MVQRFVNFVFREPTGAVEIIRQIILWGLSMGFLHLTAEQNTQTMALASALLFWANRAMVTSTIAEKPDVH